MTRDSALVNGNRPESLLDYVSRYLVHSITNGEIVAGERLSPVKLAKELGVSHIPVREALTGLEASGYVMRLPRVGFFVTEISIAQVEETYRLRQLLEDEAHKIAVPKLVNKDIDRMRTLNLLAEDAIRARSASFIDINREFHFVAFEKAESQSLIRFLNQLWDASQRYQSTMAYDRIPPGVLHLQHEGLIEAFAARDVELVNKRMAEHRGYTLAALRNARL